MATGQCHRSSWAGPELICTLGYKGEWWYPEIGSCFFAASVNAQLPMPGLLGCSWKGKVLSLVASKSFLFAGAENGLGGPRLSPGSGSFACSGVDGVWPPGPTFHSGYLRTLWPQPGLPLGGVSFPFGPQMWPAGSPSTGPMTAASSMPSASSSGTPGAMASCCRPQRSSPRPRRCGWPFRPS